MVWLKEGAKLSDHLVCNKVPNGLVDAGKTVRGKSVALHPCVSKIHP